MILTLRDETGTLQEQEIKELIQAHTSIYEEAQQGHAKYAQDLGWLNVEEWADEQTLQRIESLAEVIRNEAEVFILIGVGGSNNGARAAIEAFGSTGPKIIYTGTNTAPVALEYALNEGKGKSVYLNCIAKNFETLEPGLAFRLFRTQLEQAYGANAAKRIIVTGTEGSELQKLARQEGYTFLPFPTNIGGRFSVLSNVGLLPMAVAGINIRELVQGARELAESFKKEKAEENQAFRYAIIRNLLLEKGYKIELLASFEPRLRLFNKWWIQLFAESEGKTGLGLFPTAAEYTEELHSLGQYVQEGTPIIFESFLEIKNCCGELTVPPSAIKDNFDYLTGKSIREINKIAFQSTLSAHSKRLPCLIFALEQLDAYNLGKLFYFFQFACYLSGEILGVNPFTQPGVEAYKQRMFKGLGKNL